MVDDLHVCGSEEAQAIYGSRSLENTFPQLIDYLPKGKKILDVGCGPGTITLDVAGIVSPGIVTGIDLEKLISAAKLLETTLGYTLPGQVMKSGPRY